MQQRSANGPRCCALRGRFLPQIGLTFGTPPRASLVRAFVRLGRHHIAANAAAMGGAHTATAIGFVSAFSRLPVHPVNTKANNRAMILIRAIPFCQVSKQERCREWNAIIGIGGWKYDPRENRESARSRPTSGCIRTRSGPSEPILDRGPSDHLSAFSFVLRNRRFKVGLSYATGTYRWILRWGFPKQFAP